jgi:hypothetical protein
MYFDGRGVAKDYVQAHEWISLAAAAGDAQALKTQELAAAKMSSAQVTASVKMAKDWVQAKAQEEATRCQISNSECN